MRNFIFKYIFIPRKKFILAPEDKIIGNSAVVLTFMKGECMATTNLWKITYQSVTIFHFIRF